MDAILLRGSLDQSISPYKSQIRNPNKIHRPFISMPSENFLPPHFHTIGLLQAPPPFLSHSYPPYSLQQPPLLPLPAANPRRIAAGRGPANKKLNNGNRTRSDSSLTPKKSKYPKREEKKSPEKSSSTSPSGPDPRDLPKNVTRVLPFFSSTGNNANNCVNTNSLSSPKAVENQVDLFSGSAAFTISPPPSSLPLPTFSLRPKLSCHAEAAGIDTGATDNLRRLLRLH